MTFADLPIESFTEEVASTSVTPSGGAAAAIGGAMGAALCEMTCIHTLGKDEYGDAAADVGEIREKLAASRARLLELADADSAAVDELQAAFEGSGSTERSVAAASRRATEVPLEIAEACLDVVEYAVVVTEKGNRNALADAVTGAYLAHAALRASVTTVRANLDLPMDATSVAKLEERSADIETDAETALERVTTNLDGAT